MIVRFNDFLAGADIEDKVELKGSFCMERCGEGINWKINDEILSSPSVEEGTETFKSKVLGAFESTTHESPPDDRNARSA